MPRGSWSISTEIWVDVLGGLPSDRSILHAEASAVQAGSFASGRVVDAAGRLVAECRQRGREVAFGPDTGQVAAPHVLSADGSDLSELIGLRPQGGSLVLDVTSVLHGGVSLAASELAATWSRTDSGSSLATSALHIVHTRAVPLGSRVEFRPTTRYAGRSLWLTDVVGTVDGKVCSTTRVTAQF